MLSHFVDFVYARIRTYLCLEEETENQSTSEVFQLDHSQKEEHNLSSPAIEEEV